MAVRDYVSDVVNAYWDLYLAYRQLEAKTVAMNEALDTWRKIKNDPEADEIRIALAKEQYFRFKADVDEAIAGRVVQGTQGRNGSTGGTVRGVDGVQVAERRLRLLIGLPIADGKMLRPDDDPEQAKMIFDWSSVTDEALMGRPELRKQQLKVRQREMELLAARNFLNPRLDAVGRYRFRGFGDDLVDYNKGSNAVGSMMEGKNQEWFVGAEFNIPIGYRKAHAAVSHAELMVSRERAVHREQQKAVVHDVMNAVGEAERAFEACENSMNRFRAAEVVVGAMLNRDNSFEDVDPDRLFDAQRRVVEAKIEFFRARVEYAIAVKNVHLEKNSLMAYNNLQIYDGVIPLTVTSDAAGEERLYQDQSVPLQSVPETPPAAEADVLKSSSSEAEQDFEVGEVSPVSQGQQPSEYLEQESYDDEIMPDQAYEQTEANDSAEEFRIDPEFTGE